MSKHHEMRKTIIGLTIGFIIGLIDLIPMIMQKLTWDANISALTMWVSAGFLTARIDLNINPIIKGILIAFLVLLPGAILIGWKEPLSLVPVAVMTIILGGLPGFTINRLISKKDNTQHA